MNTYLHQQPPARQFFAFLGLASGLFLVNMVLTSWLFPGLAEALRLAPDAITPHMIARFKWAQVLSSLFIFILPALLFGYFSSPGPLPYVGIKKQASPVLLALAIALLFGVQPLVTWLGHQNAKMHFGGMQQELEQLEQLYNKAMQTFLRMRSPADLAINLLVMALLPAIGEELFFRGALQKTLLRMSGRPWLAIVLSALIFALLHGTFFKAVPIFALGVLLGTVYHVTRNLWYNIVIHFLNNGLAVLAVYYGSSSSFLKQLNDDTLQVPLYAAILSAAVAVTVVVLMQRKSNELAPGHLADDPSETL